MSVFKCVSEYVSACNVSTITHGVDLLFAWILLHGRLILHGGCICSLGYFPFQPMVHDWFIEGCGMCCPVCGRAHIKDPLLLIGKSSLCGDSGFHLKKYVTMTICLLSSSR